MTDKERLEEIETKYSTLTVSSEKNGTEYTEVDVEDLVFLIQNSFKQAERADKNAQDLEDMDRQLYSEQQQNKRLREALEFYADENNYVVDISEVEFLEDIPYAKPPIVYERGIKARQALEETE